MSASEAAGLTTAAVTLLQPGIPAAAALETATARETVAAWNKTASRSTTANFTTAASRGTAADWLLSPRSELLTGI